jgi:hypothetical protein
MPLAVLGEEILGKGNSCLQRQSLRGESVNGLQVSSKFLAAVVDGVAALTEFAQKVRPGKTSDVGSLPSVDSLDANKPMAR